MTLPLDDAKTYQIFQDGQTYGIFQFESSGMRDILRKAKPQRLDDLIALNALYRPGPLRSGMVDDFIARKQGKTEVKYELPELEPILADTYGVIAYQEQVMRISNVLAGFTLGEADLLRKAMGKKNPEVMAKMRGKFVEGAKKNGINEKKAAHIFELMEHFAGYGFNKSHSTAYAFLAYQTAYLKANYPWHFAAALLTIEAQNTDKLALYLGECRERGIPVLPPDINESQLRVHRRAATGRPLRADGDQERRRRRDRVAARGPRRSRAASDRSTRSARISISGSSTSACSKAWSRRARSIRSGATMRSLAALPSRELRPRLLAAIDAACEHGARHQRDRDEGQAQLFGGFGDEPARPPAARRRRLARRRRRGPRPSSSRSRRKRSASTGAGIPIDRYASALKEFGARSTARARRRCRSPARGATRWGPGGRKPIEPDTSIGGIVAACRQLKTRKGDRMAVFTLEDAQGGVEVIAFPEAYQRAASLIETGTMVLVRGKLERDDESVRILASEIVPIEAVRERLAREVAIRVRAGRPVPSFEALGEIFCRHRGDRRVSFEIELPTRQRLRVTADVPSQIRVRPSSTLIAEVEQVVGQGSVSLR